MNDAETRDRTAAPRVAAGWLAALAAPGAFGLTGPTIVLPQIADGLGVDVATATWLATVNGLGVAIGAPLAAALIAGRGVRFTLILNALLMTAGTLLVAVAPGLETALAGRALQALGSAGLIAVAMNLAGTAGRMGLIAASLATVASVGALVGSLATDWISWRVALMLPALALIGLIGVLGTSGPARGPARPFDVPGLLYVLALGTALTFLPSRPLPSLIAAAVLAVLLALHVRRRPEGFLPHSLLRDRRFTVYCGLILVLGTSYFALLYVVPSRLDHGTAWNAGTIGLAAMAVQLVAAALAFGLAATASRLGRAATVGVLIAFGAAAPLLAFAAGPTPALAALGAALIAAAGGQGILIAFATARTDPRDTPLAIGLFNLCYQLGGAFGPALLPLLT
ncbi:Predicted arabinose efflux permease, MFS family [Glycomyces sambucus]|uniref:Predicted arabinose efflux permease, MFS family n=1 Tax=Glycomyces sambucus TaxID=380244 RepID=A0A1G9CQD1_9ACTN|nr:MFS transporter [Glycomyces sambucus]SDK53809.1 Predicted arabinose efflux permease, MFS family [Glycomyces sambucus]